MSVTKFIFKQIDILGYIPQNTYHDKNARLALKNQVYSNNNPKNCTLDMVIQKGSENVVQPVLVNIHGGGFVAGDKKYRKSFSEYCTKFGVKVLNINYSLAPTANLPQILSELTDIFEWIKTNSQTLCFDQNKIILCGDSAGAYLAVWLCVLANQKVPLNSINLSKIDTKIAGVVLFSGIYFPTQSLEAPMILDINHTLWEYLCGEKFVDFDTCKRHKYFEYLDVGKYVDSNFPPTFVSHSKADIFCGDNGEKLVKKLQECGVPYREVCSQKDIHDWQENMFTKSAKRTLEHFDKYMTDIVADIVTNQNNSTISIEK